MKIQILGTGCPKCRRLADHAWQAVEQLGIRADIEKVTDLNDILALGVMTTPALAVDNQVKTAGKVPSVEDIKKLIQ